MEVTNSSKSKLKLCAIQTYLSNLSKKRSKLSEYLESNKCNTAKFS